MQLFRTNILKHVATLALMLLFVLSNTPKQLLHNLFATHTDCKKAKPLSSHSFHIDQQRFHCQCDHLVVESPFTHYQDALIPDQPINYRAFTASSYTFKTNSRQFLFSLRGPPVE